ncbi:unnamed protein product [Effrenium voratum]|uniref:Myosin motor domain-containing protein n=1 Tax=Effrenium voratum TaxID=2562239 RepID=A0AA36MXA9_9DINO|nr:unnamed protein product [Effrenium voratum]
MASFEVEDLLWVSCPHRVWRPGRVIDEGEGLLLQLEPEDEEEEPAPLPLPLPPKRLLRRNVVLLGEGALRYDNLTEVPELHEAAVLHALDVRFAHQQIYTLTGPVLLAVNPFRSLPLYGQDALRSFAARQVGVAAAPKPHVFGIAAKALEGIRERYESQTVLISGESGAGKTETTKFVMQFLALASAERPAASGRKESKRTMSRVERQVLGSNPLLEAFGNAQTLRNDNSSRFGKYIELHFARPAQLGDDVPNPKLSGARIRTYLLEKVRVIRQSEGERSFHVFYQALAAAANGGDQLEGFQFPPDSFKYLRHDQAKAAEDLQQYEATLSAMSAIGLSHEVPKIFRVLAAILHMGNLSFNVSGESCQVAGEGNTLALIAELLAVPSKDLAAALTTRTRQVPGEGVIRSPQNLEKSAACRDALARHLYHAIFKYIVERSNSSIGVGKESRAKASAGFWTSSASSSSRRTPWSSSASTTPMSSCSSSSMSSSSSTRRHCIRRRASNGKPRTSRTMPTSWSCFHVGGTAEAWCNKLVRLHEGKGHFSHDRLKKGTFIISHFAGPVTYLCTEFLEKNKDELSADLVQCLKDSDDAFVRERFEEHDRVFGTSQSGKLGGDGRNQRVMKAQRYSVSGEFRQQLQELLQQIERTEPHFIRCIKPNPKNQAFVDGDSSKPFFHRPSVAEQLSYQGVLAAIKVARAGFPVRFWHVEFLREFRCLAPVELRTALEAALKESTDELAPSEAATKSVKALLACPEIQAALSGKRWALGHTRIFLKQDHSSALRALRAKLRTKSATRLQATQRRISQRKAYLAVRRGVLRLQALLRGQMARRQARSWRCAKAATKVIALLRSCAALARRKAARTIALSLQSQVRGSKSRQQFRADKDRVRRLQRWWRSWKKRRRFRNLQQSVLRLQCAWRGHLARRESQRRSLRRFALTRAVRRLVRLRRRRLAERAWRAKMLERYHQAAVKRRSSIVCKTSAELVREVMELRQLCDEQQEEIEWLEQQNSTWRDTIEDLRHRACLRIRSFFR